MRVYERSSERWEIELREQLVVTRRFENDALIDESPVEHSSSLRAKWEADKLCSRLAANGYTRAGSADAAIGRADLEAALRASPDDLETYLVYADFLSDHGDDWGQLISVQHALRGVRSTTTQHDELARLEVMLRFKLGARLWGRLGETVFEEATQRYLADLIDCEWFCGFLRAVSIRYLEEDLFAPVIGTLSELPIAMLLRDATLVEHEWEPNTIEAFVSRTWPLVERVQIVGRIDAWRVVPLFANAPRLRHVELIQAHTTDAVFMAIDPIAAQLETLILRTGVFSPTGIAELAAMRLPALKKLELSGRMPSDAHARLKHLAPSVRIYDV